MARAYLYPESLEHEDSGGGAGGSFTDASRYDYVDDAYGSWDDSGSYVGAQSIGGGGTPEVRYNLTAFVPSAASITSVTAGIRARHTSGPSFPSSARPIIRIAGANYNGSFSGLNAPYENVTNTWTTNPATASPWTVGDLAGLIAGCEMNYGGASRTDRITGIWVEVVYEGVAGPNDPAIDAASRRLHDFQRQRDFPRLGLPLHIGLDLELMDRLRVAHFAGPHPTDQGWRPSVWQARLLRGYDITVTPGSGTVELKARDLRKLMCLMRDDAWTRLTVRALGDGVARFNTGALRQYQRASNAWVLDPASMLYVKLDDNQEPYHDEGLAFFGASQAIVIQNSFKNGTFTGWTSFGTGTNGSAIAAGDADPWDEDTTGVTQSLLVTAGNPHTTDTYVLGTSSASQAGGTKLRITVWYKKVAGDPLYYTLSRAVDANFWRESDQTWAGTSAVWNPLPDPGHNEWTKYVVPYAIDVGVGATTVRNRVGFPNAATDASQGNCYCILVEVADDNVPSLGPIVTETVAVTRAVGSYVYSNNDLARVWNNDQGAFSAEVIPNWTPTEIGNTNKTVAWLEYDSDNWEWIYYDGTNDRWVFERKVATVVNRAVLAATPVRGTTYKLVARWTGSNAELALTAFTASIFIDGVKGTDVATSAAPTESATSDLEIGSKAGAEHFGGQIRLIRSLQYAPNDTECARMPV